MESSTMRRSNPADDVEQLHPPVQHYLLDDEVVA